MENDTVNKKYTINTILMNKLSVEYVITQGLQLAIQFSIIQSSKFCIKTDKRDL